MHAVNHHGRHSPCTSLLLLGFQAVQQCELRAEGPTLRTPGGASTQDKTHKQAQPALRCYKAVSYEVFTLENMWRSKRTKHTHI